MRLEKEELEKDIATGEEQLKTVEEAIREYEEQIPQLQQASSETKVTTESKFIFLCSFLTVSYLSADIIFFYGVPHRKNG